MKLVFPLSGFFLSGAKTHFSQIFAKLIFYDTFNFKLCILRRSFSDPAEIHFPPNFFCYSPRSYYVKASTSPKNFGPKWPRARVMPKNLKTASQGTKNEHFLKSHNLLLDSHSLTKFGGMID